MFHLFIDRALASQALIAWTNFFRGFVSRAWGEVCGDSDPTPQAEREILAVSTLALTIRALHKYFLAIWTGRNLVLHESNTQCVDIVHADLNHDIQNLYALQSTFSPAVIQSNFVVPLALRLTSSPRNRRQWLWLAWLATSHASLQGTSQQMIPLYFPHAPTRPSAPRSPQAPPPSQVLTVPPILQPQLPITAFLSSTAFTLP